jgi:phage-related holin
MDIVQVQTFLRYIAELPEVQFIAASILVNTALAVAASIRNSDFHLPALANFLWRHLLPYIVAYVSIRITADELGLQAVATATWFIIEASLIGRIVASLHELGIPLPENLAKLLKKDH